MTDTYNGVVHGMSAREYHAIRGRMQSSSLKYMLQSPAHWLAHSQEENEPTPAMQLGTIVHALVLEPDTIADAVCVRPDDAPDKRSAAGKRWHEDFNAQAGDRIVISASDYARAQASATALRAHPAARLLDDAQIEVSMFWEAQYGAPCKLRADVIAPDHTFVLDLKTTGDASLHEFARAVWNYRYDLQACWYLGGVEHVTGYAPHSFIIAAVETVPPHGVMFYRIEESALELARRDINHALFEFVLARESGVWRGYPTDIVPLALPRWAQSAT